MPRTCSQPGYKRPWSPPLLNQVLTSSVPGRGAVLMRGKSPSRSQEVGTQASSPLPLQGWDFLFLRLFQHNKAGSFPLGSAVSRPGVG